VLTGDALLTLGFQILSALDARHRVGTECALALTGMLARAAGTGGLITGQAIDLAPPVQRDAAAVLLIHENKTARMIAASMEMGALLAGADAVTRERVRRAGIDAGCAFQIVDDLLDLEGTPESLGKTPGKDVDVGKLTYPAVVGAARAREEAGRRIAGARAGLADLAGTPLDSLIRFLGERSS
jgi:geranylgeranyl pyrophosphate synthase